MAKPSVSSYSSSSNVQFYSSTGYYTNRSGRLCQGPRKVFCFCLLAVITPAFFISLVLVMRFVLNGSATYHINPSDMRILDHKISTMWCQKETIRMNTSFTAFLTEGVPKLVKAPVPLTTTKTLIIPDDHKEYWGFYLLKGSSFKIRTCALQKGGTLLIVKGRSHLQHCAYIGDSDSAGDSDEFSNSNSVEDLLRQGKTARPPPSDSQEEMTAILAKIRSFVKHRSKGHQRLKDNLAGWMLIDPTNNKDSRSGNEVVARQTPLSPEESILNSTTPSSTERLVYSTTEKNEPLPLRQITDNASSKATTETTTSHHKIRHANSLHQRHKLEQLEAERELQSHGTTVGGTEAPAAPSATVPGRLSLPEHGRILRRKRNTAEVRKLTDSGENGAFEDDTIDENPLKELESIKQNVTGNLMKRSDTPASVWKAQHSAHEGILNDTNPYGIIDGSDSESESSFSSSEEALAKCEGVIASLYLKQLPASECGDPDTIPIVFEQTVNSSGYYYFIFGSENEKRDNVIHARFELEKFVYDLPLPLIDCDGVRECRVNLTFWSSQKLVVQIPQPAPENESVWDEVYIAESECEPRVLLYLMFVFIVPIFIILCAFQ